MKYSVHLLGILVRPVAQYQRIFRQGVLRPACRVIGPFADDERSVQAALLLKPLWEWYQYVPFWMMGKYRYA